MSVSSYMMISIWHAIIFVSYYQRLLMFSLRTVVNLIKSSTYRNSYCILERVKSRWYCSTDTLNTVVPEYYFLSHILTLCLYKTYQLDLQSRNPKVKFFQNSALRWWYFSLKNFALFFPEYKLYVRPCYVVLFIWPCGKIRKSEIIQNSVPKL